MIVTFNDDCWSTQNYAWQQSLLQVLVLLTKREEHAILADANLMMNWCSVNIKLYVDYFRTRLAHATARTNSLKINISPNGSNGVFSEPPWTLTATAAWDILNRPLRVVLENNNSDRLFVESTVMSFSRWCSNGSIECVMGGGSTMEAHIATTANDLAAKWRTFYMFDSDRLHHSELDPIWAPPSGDNCQGYRFEVACANLPRSRWHRLERRSIENYLPDVVLKTVDPFKTSVLFGASVGAMVRFYNLKKGLTGDGIWPAHPNKLPRAARSQGFWTALPAAEINSLEIGFGSNVSDEFARVPANHPWPSDILQEMDALNEALQDAI